MMKKKIKKIEIEEVVEQKTAVCKDCKKEFKYMPPRRPYPLWYIKYGRKYCDKCSKERKDLMNNLHDIKIEDCDDGY